LGQPRRKERGKREHVGVEQSTIHFREGSGVNRSRRNTFLKVWLRKEAFRSSGAPTLHAQKREKKGNVGPYQNYDVEEKRGGEKSQNFNLLFSAGAFNIMDQVIRET